MSKLQFEAFQYERAKALITLWGSMDSVNKSVHGIEFELQVQSALSQSNFFMQGCK